LNPARFFVTVVPVALALTLAPLAPALCSDDRPVTGTQVTMQQLFRDLALVFRLSLEESRFEDPSHRDEILTSLYALAANAEQLDSHGRDADPSSEFFQRALVRDANEAVMRFRQGQFEGTLFLIDQLIDNCFACHSRSRSDRTFQIGERFLEGTPVETLTEENRARVQAAMRQFDDALDTYELLFASPARPASKIAASGVFEDYLRVCLRVEEDCERAIATFERFRLRSDVPPYLDARLEGWSGDIKKIAKKREQARRDPLGCGRELIRDAQYQTAFPNDPQGMVGFMVASGCLHRYLETRPADDRRLAEACYLLGVAESHVSPSYWQSQTEALLEKAIRTSPQSVYGRMAFNFLEEYTVSGYTGSSGVNIPPDVEARLDELRSLIESDGPN